MFCSLHGEMIFLIRYRIAIKLTISHFRMFWPGVFFNILQARCRHRSSSKMSSISAHFLKYSRRCLTTVSTYSKARQNCRFNCDATFRVFWRRCWRSCDLPFKNDTLWKIGIHCQGLRNRAPWREFWVQRSCLGWLLLAQNRCRLC